MKKPDYSEFLKRAAKQRARILALRDAGKTMQAIADDVGISRQRVHQLLRKSDPRA